MRNVEMLEKRLLKQVEPPFTDPDEETPNRTLDYPFRLSGVGV